MQEHVIETVIFKLTPKIAKDKFIELATKSNDIIQNFPGFVARRLSCAEDGTWIEHIEWKTMNHAKMASDALMKEEALMPFLQSIEGESVNMHHASLEVSIG